MEIEKPKKSEMVPENANQDCPGVQSNDAGKKSACDGCPNQTKCKSGELKKELNETKEDVFKKLSKIKHKIIVLSGKGGVGKSTTAAQLALLLASQGKEVGLLDIDICGPSIPRMLGLEGNDVHPTNDGWQPVYAEDNLGVMSIGFMLGNPDDAIIWRGPRKNGLIKQFLTSVSWGELDYLIIDSPPGTSDEHISIVQYIQTTKHDGVVIVTTPQEMAMCDVRKQLSFCKKTKCNILGVVENMSGFVCPHCTKESQIFPPIKGGAQKMCQDFGINLLGKIPLDPALLLSCEKGKSICKTHPKSQTALSYMEIAKKIEKLVQ